MKFLKKLFKIGLILGLLFVAVLVGVFFYVNSGSFVQKHVLPAASDAIGQPITAGDVEFSAFKMVALSDFKVGAADDPLFTAKTIRVRYDALGALSGKIHVQEVTIVEAVANVTDEKLEELAGEPSGEAAPEPESSESGEMPDLEIILENVKIEDVALNYSQAGEAPMEAKVSNISVSLPSMKNNGEEFVLDIGANAAFTQAEAVNVSAKLALAITGKLNGFDPEAVNLKASIEELVGSANGKELPSAVFSLEVDVQPESDGFKIVETVNVRDGESILAHSRAEGSVTTAGAGAFDIEARIPDARLFNLLAAFAGDYDFGETNLSYDGKLTMTDDGGAVSQGALQVAALSVASEALEIPRIEPMAIALNHEVGYNCESNVLGLNAFALAVAANSREVITAKLSDAIELNLDDPEAAAGEASATFPVVVDALDLGLFKPFIPASEAFTFNGGQLDAKIDVQIQKGGNAINAKGFSQLAALDFNASGQDFKDFGLRKDFEVDLKDMNTLIGQNQVALTRGSEAFFKTATTSSLTLDPLAGEISTTLNSEGKGLWETIAAFVGDYDFGSSALGGKLDVTLANDKADLGVDIGLTDLTVSAPGIPAVRPLAIKVGLRANQDLKASITKVSDLQVLGKEGGKDFLALTLDNAISIDASGKEPKANDFALTAKLSPLGLDFVAPFAKDAGVSGLGGTVASDLKIGVGGLGKSLTVNGNAKLDKVTAKVAGSGELTKPITAGTTLDLAFTDFKTLSIKSLSASVGDGSADLAKVTVGGQLQVPLGPELTKLSVDVPDPIDADALLALWKAEETAETAETTTEPPAEEEAAEFPDMWVEAGVNVNEVRYREIVAKAIKTTVVIKERKATISDTSLSLNEGSVVVKGQADLKDMKALVFSGDTQVENIQLTPIINSFVPDVPVTIGGGLKSFKADFSGTSTDWDVLSKNLLANAEFALDALTVKQAADSKFSQAMSLLLTTVGLNWEDMTFADGHGSFTAKDGMLNINPLQVTAHELRLNSTGAVSMLNWEPDLKFGIAVADGLSRRLEKKRIPLRPIPGDTRFKSAPDFKVYGPMDPTALTKTVVWEYTKSFAQNALINEISERSPEAAAIFGALTGGNQGNAEKGEDGQQQNANPLGGLLNNVLGGNQTQQTEQQNPPAGQQPATPEKEEAPANNAGSLIGTGLKIFGAVQEQKEREKRDEEAQKEPQKEEPPPAKKDPLNDAVNGALKNLFR